MKLQIITQGFDLSDGLSAHVERRLAFALSHAEDDVSRVTVRLSDLNGPRGGIDKCCAIELRLKNAAPLVVKDVQSDLYVAIDRAAERIGRAFLRRLARRQAAALHAPRHPRILGPLA